ncbi:MAG: hypothetical protein V4595_12315 [Pseudomonadota bacterium]
MTHQSEVIDRRPLRSRPAGTIEDRRSTRCAIDRENEHQADLVNEAGAKEPASFEKQAVDPEFGTEDRDDLVRLEVGLAGKDVADAVLTQSRELRVGCSLG